MARKHHNQGSTQNQQNHGKDGAQAKPASSSDEKSDLFKRHDSKLDPDTVDASVTNVETRTTTKDEAAPAPTQPATDTRSNTVTNQLIDSLFGLNLYTLGMIAAVGLAIALTLFKTTLGAQAPKIYLIWTTPPSTFQERNFKVIDAYLFHHPDSQIYIYATHLSATTFRAYTDAGYNVSTVPADDASLKRLADGCPGQAWMENIEHWRANGRYFYSHVTDFIRFCALYKWGGVYSDFDALQLQRLNLYGETFIGKDSSGAKGKCEWCLPGGDAYLAPGVMGASKGHHLVRDSLVIAFEGKYDPEIFNGVGPMAVTKAYKQDSSDVNVLPRHVLYPYSYLTSWKTFEESPDGDVLAESLARKSASLHLYGHKTKHLQVGRGSTVESVMRMQTVVQEPWLDGRSVNPKPKVTLQAPRYLGVRQHMEEVKNLRVVVETMPTGTKIGATIRALHGGSVKIASASPKSAKAKFSKQEWSNVLKLSDASPADLNVQLSRLLYLGPSLQDGKDKLLIDITTEASTKPLASTSIPIYHVNQLVTIMVKTMDRMNKVFSLVESAQKFYPNISIIVTDDGKSALNHKEGPKRGFYYLPLPFDVGLSAGRNRMVKMVGTKYVLTLDDDFILDENSVIEALLHALETPKGISSSGQLEYFDIAAAKNPEDEERFELDFCGKMHISESKVLSLGSGSYGSHSGCHHVDFVPNIFLARTQVLQERIQWDELLKLGEHEDFFLRAKKLGIKTLTCPGVSFNHAQVQHWLKKTNYDRMRARVFDFLRLSLRKHGLKKLISFGRTMMDLVLPQPITDLTVSQILAHTITLTWTSPALSFKVLQSSDGGESWGPVNYGQGENFEPVPIVASTDPEGQKRLEGAFNRLVVMGLNPSTVYMFRVYAGNRFDYEQHGKTLTVSTLSVHQENDINLLENPSFADKAAFYTITPNNTFEIISSPSPPESSTSSYSARSQITTVGYLLPNPSLAGISQFLGGPALHEKLSRQWPAGLSPRLQAKREMVLTGRSRLDKFFDEHPSWRVEMKVWFGPSRKPKVKREILERKEKVGKGPTSTLRSEGEEGYVGFCGKELNVLERGRPDWEGSQEFDRSNSEWQSASVSFCLSDWATVDGVEVAAIVETYRGSVVWDHLVFTVM
ncbi:hypothetical protein HDV05_008035 [Chytridiales sp. JEL 0842]|nr:hypothetical protein HDV05_008035 [Chytridiales sp. JEL 0842]